jgi:OOP family OmpA-OmpF porin
MVIFLGVSCASSPDIAPLNASPVTPGAGERVVVDHAYLVIDSSASISEDFAREKALVESFVGAMPDGTYQTGSVAFGGYARQASELSPFDRSAARKQASELELLREGTPLDRVLGEVGGALAGKRGRAAVVIFSDGVPTDPVGREIDQQRVLDAAKNLTKGYDGQVCLHTVQMGSDPAGAAFLNKLANTSSCGSARSSSSIQNVAALQNFQRSIFLGATQARGVAVAPPDTDGDGVIDGRDQCPGTPFTAKVDARGCWRIQGLRFAFDSDQIAPKYFAELDELARVLARNPNLRVRIDGHTDAIGAERYNQGLSERRAAAVRSYLVKKAGIDSKRLETRGFGLTKPAYTNETEEGRAGNRRTELTTL